MTLAKVLIGGTWKDSVGSESFQAENPATMQPIAESFPISPWSEVDEALTAAAKAAEQLRALPRGKIADFLEAFAARLEAKKDVLVAKANEESALPVSPRLADNEFPRTVGQLRQADQVERLVGRDATADDEEDAALVEGLDHARDPLRAGTRASSGSGRP